MRQRDANCTLRVSPSSEKQLPVFSALLHVQFYSALVVVIIPLFLIKCKRIP